MKICNSSFLALVLVSVSWGCVRQKSEQPDIEKTVKKLGGVISESPSGLSVLVDGAMLTDSDIAAIAALKNLHSLSLARTNVSDAMLKGICKIESLEALWLNDTSVSDAGIRCLGALPALRQLGLSGTSVKGTSLDNLPPTLNVLDLTGTSIQQGEASRLRRFKLSQLMIADTGIGDKDLVEIASIEGLTFLDIDNCLITDVGAARLARLKNLEVVFLGGTGISLNGIMAICELPRLRGVRHTRNQLSRTQAEELQEKFPRLRIECKD